MILIEELLNTTMEKTDQQKVIDHLFSFILKNLLQD